MRIKRKHVSLKEKGMKKKDFRRNLIRQNQESIHMRTKEYYQRDRLAVINKYKLKEAVKQAIDEFLIEESMRQKMEKYLEETLQKSKEMNEDKKNKEEKKDE